MKQIYLFKRGSLFFSRTMSTKSSSTSSFSNSGKTLLKFKSEERLTEYETPHPEWKLGDGAVNETPEFSAPWDEHKKISFDPYGAGRNPINNYLLTVTALAPKPVSISLVRLFIFFNFLCLHYYV